MYTSRSLKEQDFRDVQFTSTARVALSAVSMSPVALLGFFDVVIQSEGLLGG